MPVDLDMPRFRPRFPWINSDLQAMANTIAPPPTELGARSTTMINVALNDGTGDSLNNTLDMPLADRGGPLMILIHGAGGDETSKHILASTRYLLSLGYRVLRVNLRGAPPSPTKHGGMYYGGSSPELGTLFASLDPALRAKGLFAVGYSLGGAILLKYLGEQGDQAALVGAATVSAPIDLSATSRELQRLRNYFYHCMVLRDMKEQTARGYPVGDRQRAIVASVRSIWELDDCYTAPKHGFAGAEDCYEKCKATRFMPSIRKPTLTISAADDSWVPIEAYRGVDWAANPALTPLLPDGGGHVGFHAADDDVPWHDRAISRFVERITP